MHEDLKCRYGKRGRGKLFVEGMVVALEPMINQGTRNIKQLKDGGQQLQTENHLHTLNMILP
jgi:methionyl aminopeptidase